MKTKNTDDLNLPSLKVGDKIPCCGFVVFEDCFGIKNYRRSFDGHVLREGEIFVESLEEACTLTGKEFNPYSASSFSEASLKEVDTLEKQISKGISSIDSSFEKIAFALYRINARKLYVARDYADIAKYCAFKFGYEKSTCYSLIAIVDRFAKRDADGNILEELDSSVKGYSVSKLSLMVNLTDDQIKELRPGMTVREIRKYIKEMEGKPAPALSASDGMEDSQQDGPSEENIIDTTAEETAPERGESYDIILSFCPANSGGYENKLPEIGKSISKVLKKHPNAVIEVSYSLP